MNMRLVRQWVSSLGLITGSVDGARQSLAQSADSFTAAAKDKASALRFRGYFQGDGRFFPRGDAVRTWMIC